MLYLLSLLNSNQRVSRLCWRYAKPAMSCLERSKCLGLALALALAVQQHNKCQECFFWKQQSLLYYSPVGGGQQVDASLFSVRLLMYLFPSFCFCPPSCSCSCNLVSFCDELMFQGQGRQIKLLSQRVIIYQLQIHLQ